MKLRANIKVLPAQSYRGKAVQLTFPEDRVGCALESVVARHIGPRPWSEISFWKNNRHVVIYSR